MSNLEHEKCCNSLNLMYPTNPPQNAPCNCSLSKLVDETQLRERLAKEIEATYNGSGDSEMGGYGKYFASIVRGNK